MRNKVLELKGFENDIEICSLGAFLRKVSPQKDDTNAQWLLEIRGFPLQAKRATSLSNLPMLARGRRINSTKKYALKPNFNLNIKSSQQFVPIKLSRYASSIYPKSSHIKELESNQWGFRLDANGTEVIFPQLEMARAFLLVNSYLSRACMTTTFIDLELDTEYESSTEHFWVHFTKASTFPPSVLESTGMRKILSWLLFNPDALNSFKSIYRYYLENSTFEYGWQKWAFRFDLPNMSGWEMGLRGRYLDRAETQFYVEEIMKVTVASPMPRSVSFSGDMLNEPEVMHGPGLEPSNDATSSDSGTAIYDAPVIDEDIEPNSNMSSVFYADEYAEVKFTKPVSTTLNAQKKGSRSDGKNGKEEVIAETTGHQVEEMRSLSTQESHIFGTSRQADVGGRKEDENHNHAVFEVFEDMVNRLHVRHGWLIEEKEIFELKKVGRSRLHNMKGTKIPRQVKSVLLKKSDASGSDFVIRLLELDTSDGVKAISTKILQEPDFQIWQEQLETFKSELVKNSLSWPNDTLNQVCGSRNKNKSLVHQRQNAPSSGNLWSDEIDNWARRANAEMSKVSLSVSS